MKIYPIKYYNQTNKYQQKNCQIQSNNSLTYSDSDFLSPSLNIQSSYNIPFCRRQQNTAVYVISDNGSYTRYESLSQAAMENNISSGSISKCLSGKNYSIKNMIVADADDVETKDEVGEISVNKDKINQQLKKLKYKSVYLISYDGHYKKFNSQKEASEYLGKDNSAAINSCLRSKSYSVEGMIPVRACDIEILNDEGSFVVDEKRVQEIAKELEKELSKNHIYVIKKDGSYKKYNSQSEAIKELNIKYLSMNKCIIDKNNTECTMLAVKASDLESEDDKGNKFVDLIKLDKYVKSLNS